VWKTGILKDLNGTFLCTKKCAAKLTHLIACKQAEIEKLKEYKATLINSAVTGKIKI
jgi:hypothetical protein